VLKLDKLRYSDIIEIKRCWLWAFGEIADDVVVVCVFDPALYQAARP